MKLGKTILFKPLLSLSLTLHKTFQKDKIKQSKMKIQS